MSTVYKIRLVGTDLFYQPTKGRFRHEKTNLGKNGKIYTTKPNLKYTEVVYVSDAILNKYDHLMTDPNFNNTQHILIDHKFEIVEYDLVEK
jgi:hypothetical protein